MNDLLKPSEVSADFMERAREQVAGMPLKHVRKLAAVTQFTPGVSGGFLAFLVLAAQERMKKEFPPK